MITMELSDLVDLVRPKRKKKPKVADHGGQVLLMAKTAYEAGMDFLGGREPEAAGLLIGPKRHRSVTHFVPDMTGKSTPGSFTWDHDGLNKILRQYLPLGLDAKGFWHSHPSGCRRLSQGDLSFVKRVFSTPGNDETVLMPLFVDGACHPFIVHPDLRVVEATLVLF